MWYTLAKGLGWFALAGVIGILIGWLLRSIVAGRQLARARSRHPSHVDPAELDRLRGRIAELESVAAERDQLLVDLAACRDAAVVAERNTGEHRIIRPEGAENPTASDAGEPPPVPRTSSAAAAALGRPVEIDDLKVVEGIGPRVEELCHGIGIRTWADLSSTEVSLLRTMLSDAGPRFRTQDPSTWPRQAALLAEGRWDEFKRFTDETAGGPATG
jgi:predicted flap endonuclease-1-like 5' DNA nuclease